MSRPHLAYFLVRYPHLSQTFVQREVEAMCRSGFRVTVFTCRQWSGGEAGEEGQKPAIVPLSCMWSLLVLAELARCVILAPGSVLAAVRLAVVRFRWNSFENMIANAWGLVVGLALAREANLRGVQLAHGAWAALPATAAWVVAERCGIPFSLGGHAYDLYRHGGDGLLCGKMEAACFIHTSTEANVRYLSKLSPESCGKIVLSRRGLPALPEFREQRGGSGEAMLLTVGRLVEKKGLHVQIGTLARLLRDGVRARLVVVGEGPLSDELKMRAEQAGVGSKVEFTGALRFNEVQELYRNAHVFLFTGVVDSQGDRDGLPNVVPEAMAYGLPVVACGEGAVKEAVADGETGLWLPGHEPEALAAAVRRVLEDEKLALKLMRGGRRWVEENYDSSKNAAVLARAFKKVLVSQTGEESSSGS